jgi:hypothetical protein
MNLHQTVVNIVVRLVHLNSPMYGNVILHLPMISHIKASLHHVVGLKFEDIHVVRELSDLFPDDLLRMPPERRLSSRLSCSLVPLL